MTRYDWPDEFTDSTDLLEERQEHAAAISGPGITSGLIGNIDDLNDVIQANFDAARLWMPLGPSIMTNGQAAGNPVVAGRARAVRVSPNGRRAYVASANGGVWYSADAGASWSPVGAWGLAAAAERSGLSLTSGDLLVRFGETGSIDDPDKDVVYVGTGEIRPELGEIPGAKYEGLGVLRLHGTINAAVAAPGTNPWRREARNLSGAGIFRLAHDPAVPLSLNPAGTNTIVAATSNGLWARSGAFVEGADWQRVNFTPSRFDANDGPYCSDVVWNDMGLWVTVVGMTGEEGVWRSTGGITGTFTQITLPDLDPGQRTSLGPARHATDRMYVLGKKRWPVPGSQGLAHLWMVDLTHNQKVARSVRNFPVGLFTKEATMSGTNFVIAGDQAYYDQAIAVAQQGTADVVFVGGATKDVSGDSNASLFRLTISGTAAADDLSTDFTPLNQTAASVDRTFIGTGIHADVHDVALNGTDIWVCCDGGVFRRPAAATGTARSLNAGLATSQPGYIVSHPTLDGPMVAGTQDNGIIQRVGDTVWRLRAKGDGGGCLIHPVAPHRFMFQFNFADWRFLPIFTPVPVLRTAPPTPAETSENEKASFYSQGAVARTNSPGGARVFVGTDRIWHCANWDVLGTPLTWATVPTGTDPYGSPTIAQDSLLQGGTSENVLAIDILHEGVLANNSEGMAILVLAQRTVRIFRFSAGSWTPLTSSIVSAPSGAGLPPGAPPPPTGGKAKKRTTPPNPFLDHLPRRPNSAWTDIAVHRTSNVGHETFYVTTTGAVNVRDDGSLEGDADFDVLWWYDGNGRWYPAGLRNAPLNAAAGTGGSPAAAHSVVVDPDDPDTVYVGNRIGVWKGRIDQSGVHPTWIWRPAMEGLPQTIVEDLHVFKSPAGTYLRAALVSRGIWERDLSVLPVSVGRTFIRSLPYDTGRAELPAAPTDVRTNAALDYHSSPDLVLLPQGPQPWDPGTPNEADLLGARLPLSVVRATHDLWIMVHHRHTTPVAGANVDINLFLQRGAPAGAISGIAIDAAWRAAVLAKVRGQTATLPANLSHLGLFHPAEPVDATTPRAVKVPVDLSFAIQGAGPDDYVALIAIVTSPGNPLAATDLAPNDLETIVRRSAHVAVRKVRRI